MVLKKWAVYLRDPLLDPKLHLWGTVLEGFFRAFRDDLPLLMFQWQFMALATPALFWIRWPKLPQEPMQFAFVPLWLRSTSFLAMLPIYAL